MATNRADTLDPALLRPGRLDRKIEFPLPDRRQKRLIFSTITSKMNLSEEVDLEDCILHRRGAKPCVVLIRFWESWVTAKMAAIAASIGCHRGVWKCVQ